MKLSPSTLLRSAALALASTLALVACDDSTDGTGGSGSTSASTGAATQSSTNASSTGTTSASSTGSTGTGTSSSSSGMAELAINGKYVDDFTFEWLIASDLITLSGAGDVSTFHVQVYDNATFVIGAQNDAANLYNPGKFSRYDWTFVQSELYVCQTAFDKDTLADALATPAADPSDPANDGCGGFAWSKLTPIN
ncbi:MAG: hypothetical protein U0414_03905 [Polyangiaceae bacterium]